MSAPAEDLVIKQFLEGQSSKKYVVAIEPGWNSNVMDLIIHDDKNNTKYIEKMKYEPFLYIKNFKKYGLGLYRNDTELAEAKKKYGIVIEPLRVRDANGALVERLTEGYKFKVKTTHKTGYNALIAFFKEGGLDVWGSTNRKFRFTPSTYKKPEVEFDTKGRPGELYSHLDGDVECGISFVYNNLLKRFEIHFPATSVSRYTDDDEQGNSFIKLKADAQKDFLIEDKDYSVDYDKDTDRFIIAIKSVRENVKERERRDKKIAKVEVRVKEYESAYADIAKWTKGQAIINKTPEIVALLQEGFLDLEDPKLTWEEVDTKIEVLRDAGIWKKKHDPFYKRAKKLYTDFNKFYSEYQGLVTEGENALKVAQSEFNKLEITYKETNGHLFCTLRPVEQFMIQTGIRLFKGFDNYSDIHKLTFDIETTGLIAKVNRIFMIGLRDNRGFEKVLAVKKVDDDESERTMIWQFFQVLNHLKPALIYGYNSENFDWTFILERMEILGMKLEDQPSTFKEGVHMRRKKGVSLKIGGDTEYYTQTIAYGYNVIDILHAVRRAQAINSDIQEASLKYICKQQKIAKPNRMYVAGGDIYTMWQENLWYAVRPSDNKYKVLPDNYQQIPDEATLAKIVSVEDYYGEETKFIRGGAIVHQYLLDDLWETEKVDERFNDERFQLGKFLPTGFARTCTIGGASTWNMIMTAWSYEQNLAIPYRLQKKTFTGGLSRTFMLGKFLNVYKFDFSGLYPSLQLEHNIFPKHDVTGVLKRLLLFFKNNRDKYKKLANDESLPAEERAMYDAKQKPMKILNNSNFGANGSSFFNWADFTCAEFITCLGRLSLRNMISFFEVYGCKPTVCDTDGINMEVPEMVTVDINGRPLWTPVSIDTYTYGVDKKGNPITGANALVEKYNQEVLASPYMKLDNDGMWPTAINISRKNYANKEKDGKVKIVGNTIKQKTMPEYVKDFINEALDLLLDNKGKEVVELYYKHLTKIYTMQVPLRKIANKARVRESVEDYKNRGNDKNGRQKGAKAHMELIIQEGLKLDLGETVYYVSTGDKKGDTYSTRDKAGKIKARLLLRQDIEHNPDMLGEYNVIKYVSVFNARVEKILVPFKDVVKNSIIKDKPQDREHYSDLEMELIQFQNPNPEDNIANFFTMEAKEVDFWNRTGFDPYKVLQEFKTEIPYDGNEYLKKFEIATRKLGEIGSTVHRVYDFFGNGDFVLGFDRKKFKSNKDSGEMTEIPAELQPYVNIDPSWQTLPPTNEVYTKAKLFEDLYGEAGEFIEEKSFPLYMVEEGNLKLLKKI